MKKFLWHNLLFAAFLSVIILLLIVVYAFKYNTTINDLPAPNFSNSYSFNEKILFLKKSDISPEVLAIGSSMTLNNLHSQTVINKLKTKKYLNVASWGMSIQEEYQLLKQLTLIYKPKKIIIACSIVDFKKNDKNIDYFLIHKYLSGHNELKHHLSHFSSQYYFNNFKYAHQVRNDSSNYEYLGFDNYGAVNFNNQGFKISNNRWNTDFEENAINKREYLYLDSIGLYCQEKKIVLLFFQTPMREGLYNKLTNKKLTELNNHISKVETIIKARHQQFVDATKVKWKDYLFVDGTHLNAKGAELFTEYCFKHIH